ncbi:MAG: DinB family protein [Armatimonadetes bacterium]|nr:DinB family protein [Armatimonadota bacterium]
MTADDLVALWKPVLANLLAKCDLVGDDFPGLDEPGWQGTFQGPEGAVEEAMQTPRQLLAHLIVASYEVPKAFIGQEGFEGVREVSLSLREATPSALKSALAARVERTAELLGGLSEAQLGEERETPFGRVNLAQMLSLGAFHVMHHKAQLMLYLRLRGIRPGRFL